MTRSPNEAGTTTTTIEKMEKDPLTLFLFLSHFLMGDGSRVELEVDAARHELQLCTTASAALVLFITVDRPECAGGTLLPPPSSSA